MNRRDFCQTALKLGLFSAASSLLPWRSYAGELESAKPQFFILARVFGGWDTSLSMEPWTQAVRPDASDFFLEYRHEDLLVFNNSFVGPALKPLQEYFNRMTVFNGIFMTATDGGHDSAGLYAETGNGQGNLAVLPLELEGRIFKSQFGTLANKSPYAGQLSKAIWDLKGLVNNGSIGGAELLFDMGDRSTELSNARGAILSNTSRLALFDKLLNETPIRTEGSVISACFRSGLSSSAFLSDFGGNLDTHSAHENNHMTGLSTVFTEIKAVLDSLKSSPGVDALGNKIESNNLLDQTTVMIVSEFTRTPALNGSKGKDHNPQSNSAIVIGPGFKNEIIGGSNLVTRAQAKSGTPYLAGLPLDIKSFQPVRRREDSFIMRPDNVVATVAKSLGLDPAVISKGLGSAKILTSVLK